MQASCQTGDHFSTALQQHYWLSVSATFYYRCRDILQFYCGDKARYFKPKRDVFPTTTEQFLCLKLTRVKPQHSHNRDVKFPGKDL